MRKFYSVFLILISAALILSGCSLGGRFKRPQGLHNDSVTAGHHIKPDRDEDDSSYKIDLAEEIIEEDAVDEEYESDEEPEVDEEPVIEETRGLSDPNWYEKVEMQVTAASATDIKIKITNNSDSDIETIDEFFLVVNDPEKYKEISFEHDFSDMIYKIPAHDKRSFRYSLTEDVLKEDEEYLLTKVVFAHNMNYAIHEVFTID